MGTNQDKFSGKLLFLLFVALGVLPPQAASCPHPGVFTRPQPTPGFPSQDLDSGPRARKDISGIRLSLDGPCVSGRIGEPVFLSLL